MSDRLDWSQDQVRYDFFTQLPRPLAVMLACDLAALPPQPRVGAAAIDVSRRWIMGAADVHAVRVAARAAAWYAPHTSHPAYAAAAAANTVHTPVFYLAYSGSSVCEAVHQCGMQHAVDDHLANYEAQSRRVEFLREVLQDAPVQFLIKASVEAPSARAVLWDAMLEAGYTPQPIQPRHDPDEQSASPADLQAPAGKTRRGMFTRLWRRTANEF